MTSDKKIVFDNITPRKGFLNRLNFVDLKNDKKIVQNNQICEILILGKKRLLFFCFFICILNTIIIFQSFTYSTKNLFFVSQKVSNKQKIRGMILDRNDNIISASIISNDLYLNPRNIFNKRKLLEKIKIIFPSINTDSIKKIIKGENFRLIKKHITKNEEFELLKIGEPGLVFVKSQKRIYPQNNLFSQITGFVSKFGLPKSKIEKNQNKILEQGQNLKLTVDTKIQHIFYEELLNGLKKYKAKSAAAVMMDVNNGEIIAIVSLPDYNPNFPNSIVPFSENNLIVSARFEMGSTLKTLNVAMALENNSTIINKTFDISEPYKLTQNYLVNDINKILEPASFNDIFINSSNVGSIKIFDEVGLENQKKFFSEIGMNKSLEIDGLRVIKNKFPKNWNDLSGKSLSYGYGASITPISLINTYATLLNGGYFIEPKIIKSSKTKKFRVFSENLSIQIRELLYNVVTQGSAKMAQIDGIKIGGKTGTARKTDNKNYNDQVLTSFIGAFPINKPKYIILVLFDEPESKNGFNFYGGNTAAPVFSNILERIAIDLEVYPESNKRKILQTKNKSDETF